MTAETKTRASLGKSADGSEKTFFAHRKQPSPETSLVEKMVLSAAMAIEEKNYPLAHTILKSSMSEDMENAEAYNLLAILYEKEGDRLKAIKFFRIAYYMDQTFKAAAKNLDRIGDFRYSSDERDIQWGLTFREAKQ